MLQPVYLLTVLFFVGCSVTVYQPLVGLQRPVAIDRQQANFAGQRLLVRCHPSDYTNAEQSQTVCHRLQTLFTNQGATVEIDVPGTRALENQEEGKTKPDLTIELKSRLIDKKGAGLLGVLSVLTLTLVPATSEAIFAVDVSVRDQEGFQVAFTTLQGRFVRYLGFGVWFVNKVLDQFVREDAEKLTGNAVNKDFSQDFYAQVSQLTFNASMRTWVMRGFASRVVSTKEMDAAQP